MALLFMDGCDLADSEAAVEFRSWVQGGNASLVGQSASGGRFGGGAYTFAGSSSIGSLSKTLGAPVPTVIVGCALFIASTGAADANQLMLGFYDSGGTLECYLAYDSTTNELKAYRGDNVLLATASAPTPRQLWHHLEVKVTPANSGGTIELRVNETTLVSYTGDTRNGLGNVQQVYLRTIRPNLTVDDLYVLDTSGAHANDFLGDCRVHTLSPTADTADKDWTPSAGADNYALVDETGSYGASDYVQSDTVGHLDLYDVANPAITPAAVHGVQVSGVLAKDDTGTREARIVMKEDGATVNGATLALSTTYQETRTQLTTAPDGSPWDASALSGLQIGVEVVT